MARKKRQHGGKRKNSGRPKKKEVKTQLTIWLSQSVKDLIVETAKMMHLSAGQLIEKIISQ